MSVIVIKTTEKVNIHYKPVKGFLFIDYYNKLNEYEAAVDVFFQKIITIPRGRSVIQVCNYPGLEFGFRLGKGRDKVTMIDLSGFDTENVTDMSSMFEDCSSLQSLDLSGFDTENVTDMSSMFYDCSSLQSLDLSGFDTENVTDMSRMFNGCSSLQSLDLSDFDTKNVNDMSSMFKGCSSLYQIDCDNTSIIRAVEDK